MKKLRKIGLIVCFAAIILSALLLCGCYTAKYKLFDCSVTIFERNSPDDDELAFKKKYSTDKYTVYFDGALSAQDTDVCIQTLNKVTKTLAAAALTRARTLCTACLKPPDKRLLWRRARWSSKTARQRSANRPAPTRSAATPLPSRSTATIKSSPKTATCGRLQTKA